jgi:hypothetical protein
MTSHTPAGTSAAEPPTRPQPNRQALVGGPLLSGLADWHPRRIVMVRCDLAAAALTAVMAVPPVPVPVPFVLVFAVTLLNTLFAAAPSALIRDLFPDDRYAATTVSTMIFRASQIRRLSSPLLAVHQRPAGSRHAGIRPARSGGPDRAATRFQRGRHPTACPRRRPIRRAR